VDTRDIEHLTAALRTVGARLDARSEERSLGADPAIGATPCPVPCAQVERCLGAMREALRALELLLSQVPR